MMGAWTAIQYVGTALSLIAFVSAVALSAHLASIRGRARIVESAPPQERLEAIRDTAEFFKVDVSKLSEDKQYDIVKLQINNRSRRTLYLLFFALAIAILLATLTVITIPRSSYSTSKLPLPDGTGWIFAGYYNPNDKRFSLGPFVQDPRIPNDTMDFRKGDEITMLKDRRVFMVDFSTNGVAKKFEAPISINTENGSSFTGVTAPTGQKLVVLDVAAGHSVGNPEVAMWIRVGNPP